MLEIIDVVKRFPGVLANDQVTMSVRKGEIHGLLGENGAGKTTLMNILYGLYACDEGRILLDGEDVSIHSPNEAIALGIGMVHQHFTLIPRMTVTQNIILGMNDIPAIVPLEKLEHEIAALAEQQKIPIDPKAMVWQLSVGEQQRVEILKALYRNARLLILDEPTSVVVPQEVDALFESLRAMASAGLTIIFITHKLDEIMTITDRVTIMRDGRVVDVVNTADTNQRELAKKMVGREVVLRVHKPTTDRGETILEVDQLSAQNDRGMTALDKVSFEVARGEIVGVAGVTGNGQSELVQVLCGVRVASEGTIRILGWDATNSSPREMIAHGVGIIPADGRREGVAVTLTVRDNLFLKNYLTSSLLTRGIFVDDRALDTYANDLVKQYGVRTPSIKVETSKLSGGNLQRLILAREFARDPNLLIANHPTKGLDVGATEYVYQQLFQARANGRAVLLISANLDEILMLSDRILVMFQGRIVGDLDGSTAQPNELGLLMGGNESEYFKMKSAEEERIH